MMKICLSECDLIQIVLVIGTFVISTVGPQGGPKWRNLLNKQISLRGSTLRSVSRLCFAELEMNQIQALTK